jgi:glycine hydroxymethyltransferase
MNNIAAAAVALGLAAEPGFRAYAEQVLANARALAVALVAEGCALVTGGTDNHMMVVDCVKSFGIDGRRAEEALDVLGIATNKQLVPDDPRPAMRPSGLRLGTPAATTRGMKEDDMRRIGAWIASALRRPGDGDHLRRLAAEVEPFCSGFELPGVSI